MLTNRLGRSAKVVLSGGLLCAVVGGLALAMDRSAETILAEVYSVRVPQIPPGAQGNPQVVQGLAPSRQAALQYRAELIGELYRKQADHPALTQLLPERWQTLITSPKTAPEVETEVDQISSESKSDPIRNEAAYFKVVLAFRKAGTPGKVDSLLPTIEEFIKRFPKDDRGGEMLEALLQVTTDRALKATITQRLEQQFPFSPAVRRITVERRRREGIGRPFEVAFTDAIKGTSVNLASLKGKVVVVDFWATWCGPCVGEMPHMKTLYTQYKDQGVEFIGVSLDAPRGEGGFDQLKAFVAQNQIEWPQYYEGEPSGADFALGWGVVTIPSAFVVDGDGNLVTTEGRGRLDELIPTLLAQSKKETAPH